MSNQATESNTMKLLCIKTPSENIHFNFKNLINFSYNHEHNFIEINFLSITETIKLYGNKDDLIKAEKDLISFASSNGTRLILVVDEKMNFLSTEKRAGLLSPQTNLGIPG